MVFTEGQRRFDSQHARRARCRECSEIKAKIRTEADPERNHYTYRDDRGKIWHGRICPDCRIALALIKSREIGHRELDKVEYPTTRKGRTAEHAARIHFESLGYKVTMTTGNGPDLTLEREAARLTCEVKSCIEKSEPGCFFVQPVAANRRDDDLIAIVLPDGRVHVETMKSHLQQCPKSGTRAVTKLIRARAWVGAEECSPADKLKSAEAISKSQLKHGRFASDFRSRYE